MFLEISLGVLFMICIIQAVILVIIYYDYEQIGKSKIEELDKREQKIKDQEDYIQKLEKCESIQQNIRSLLN